MKQMDQMMTEKLSLSLFLESFYQEQMLLSIIVTSLKHSDKRLHKYLPMFPGPHYITEQLHRTLCWSCRIVAAAATSLL